MESLTAENYTDTTIGSSQTVHVLDTCYICKMFDKEDSYLWDPLLCECPHQIQCVITQLSLLVYMETL